MQPNSHLSDAVPEGPLNAITVDVEDYFQVAAFETTVSPADWDRLPARVEPNTDKVLDLLARHRVRATFFILGWVANRFPGLVKRVAAQGHEIACHGFAHRRVTTQDRKAFREDVLQAKNLLEDLTGQAVRGYRAPSFSIGRGSLWALDVLIELGFTYDSSIFPIVHDLYGMPEAPRAPFLALRPGGAIREFPPSTCRLPGFLGARSLPVSGGGWLRLLPVAAVLAGMRRINRQESGPAILYFHPWEIDPDQPRLRGPLRSRFRHYLNLKRTESKLERLLTGLRFAPAGVVLDRMGPLPEVRLD